MLDPADLEALVAGAATGETRALARLLSAVEDDPAASHGVVAELFLGGEAHVVGITGPPGVGKSTLTDGLVRLVRQEGVRPVAVLAVDPSSPFTGGALLGDRIRMQSHAADREVYIRSMATRGRLGGLAAATPRAAAVLSGLGFAYVFVETVGVGQAEVDIAAAATTTVVVLPPGFGDGVQAAKAGLLEVGDVFVVNQADLPGADAAVRRLIEMLELGPSGTWAPPVLAAVATTGEGLAEVGGAIAAHEVHVAGPGGDDDRAGTARNLVRAALEEEVALASGSLLATDRGAELVGAVARREIDPWTAARELRGYSG